MLENDDDDDDVKVVPLGREWRYSFTHS